MHEVLIKAALRTDLILHETKTFCLAGQVWTIFMFHIKLTYIQKEANNQAVIYSKLHQKHTGLQQ